MRPTKLAVSLAATAALLTTAACGGGTTSGSAADEPDQSNQAQSAPEQSESEGGDAGMAGPTAMLVGPGCDDYAEAVPDGAGSVEGMAQDPVAVAASNNPLLKTLVAAVSGELNPKVDLVDTLNGDEFTVFAPVDEAFAKLPKKTVSSLAKPANADQLSTILTYHVVPGQIAPEELAGTTQTTVQGGEVEITGQGDDLQVEDAGVICGGVQTANATVYLIDSVLMPTM